MKKKKKLITHNKHYSLTDSPLYNIQYLKRLCDVLQIDQNSLSSLLNKQIDNYHCFTTKTEREIQTPIEKLYQVHNRIASLFARIVTPNYLYSGIKGKSYVSNAEAHLNNKEMLTTDITAFFPSTTRKMIFWFFKGTMKCSTQIANTLADLCTISGHLPTGSQISMPLAYWVSAKMFEELNQLAENNQLKMTVYVDDITFSGEKIPKGFQFQVKTIINAHKHRIKQTKTTLYTEQSTKEVTGLILKDGKLLLPNRQYKKLHKHLVHWKKLIKLPGYITQIDEWYKSLMGLLNNISYFDPKYKNIIRAIKKEYSQYKDTPSNYKIVN